MDDVSFFASDPKAERVGQGGSHRVTLGAPAKMLGLYINVGEGKTEAVSCTFRVHLAVLEPCSFVEHTSGTSSCCHGSTTVGAGSEGKGSV